MSNIVTPVGRIVQGHPMKGQTKDKAGNPLTVKRGPNAGQPKTEYFFSLALDKASPEVQAFIANLKTLAQAAWPAGESNTNPRFAAKVLDGDGADENGRPWAGRDGFAGHWILRFTGGFAPQVFTRGCQARITAESDIKRGDYVRVAGSYVTNGYLQKPGMYLNHSMVEFAGHGEEIKSGPDAATVFAAPMSALPAGASATPKLSGPPPAAPDFVSAAAGLPPAPPPAPVPAGPVMTPKAAGVSYDAFKAQGWSDEQLRDHGYMV